LSAIDSILPLLDVPQPPQEVRVNQVDSRKITLEWIAPVDGGNPLSEYIIFYKPLSKSLSHRTHDFSPLSPPFLAIFFLVEYISE